MRYYRYLIACGLGLTGHSFDHLNHGVFRYDGDPKVLKEAAAVVGNDLKMLKAMVDANPEYLLIFSADHGIDAITSSGYGAGPAEALYS